MNIVILHAWLSAKIATKTDRGAGLAEYALLLFLVATACLLTLGALGTRISVLFEEITTALGG